jgi:hypothetical protein
MTACPKCGFVLKEPGPECPRCGIIFARYRPAGGSVSPAGDATRPEETVQSSPGLVRRIFRIGRWVWLAASVTVLVLLVYPSRPPIIHVTAESVVSAEAKMSEFKSASRDGQPQTLELDEPELNGWLRSNLALQRPLPALESPGNAAANPAAAQQAEAAAPQATRLPGEDPAVAEAKSAVRDIRIELMEDSMRAYVEFDFHGKTLSFSLEGRLIVRDGYLSLEPTGGRLGSMPLPAAALESAARTIFESPENRQKFRLPPHIRDIRIEGRNLKVDSR